MVLKNPKLKFLDEKPVNAEERRLTTAWGLNGKDGENLERKKI